MSNNNDFSEQGMWSLHGLFYKATESLGVDLEEHEYDDFGVGPNSIHKEKSDHKKAIYLISKAMSEEVDGINPLGTWNIPDDPEPEYSSGDIAYFSNDIADRVVFDYDHETEDVEVPMYHNGLEDFRWAVLEDLSEGDDIKSVLNEYYEDANKRSNKRPYHQLHRKILDDGVLPDSYQQDLSNVISYHKSTRGVDEFRPEDVGHRGQKGTSDGNPVGK